MNIIYITGLSLFTGYEVQGLFHDFPGPLKTYSAGSSLSNKTRILFMVLKTLISSMNTHLSIFAEQRETCPQAIS